MSKVTVYTKEGCPYCSRLTGDLKQQGVEFEEINISFNQDALKHIKTNYGADKVPVLVEGEQVTIGYQGGPG